LHQSRLARTLAPPKQPTTAFSEDEKNKRNWSLTFAGFLVYWSLPVIARLQPSVYASFEPQGSDFILTRLAVQQSP